MKLPSLLLSVSLGLTAEALAQTSTPTANPWFSGEATVVPGNSSSLLAPGTLPNILIGNPEGNQGVEWSFEAGVSNVTPRSTSFINLNNGNWRWMRSNATTTAPTAVHTQMALAANGTLTLASPASPISPTNLIVLNPSSKQLTVGGTPVLLSSGSYHALSDRFSFGSYVQAGGPAQTVLGRYNAQVPWG